MSSNEIWEKVSKCYIGLNENSPRLKKEKFGVKRRLVVKWRKKCFWTDNQMIIKVNN